MTMKWNEYGFDDLSFASERLLFYGLGLAMAEREALSKGNFLFDEAASKVEMLSPLITVNSLVAKLSEFDKKLSGLIHTCLRPAAAERGENERWNYEDFVTSMGEELIIPDAKLSPLRTRKYFDQRRRMLNRLRYFTNDFNLAKYYYKQSDTTQKLTYYEAQVSWENAPWQAFTMNYSNYDSKSIVHASWDYDQRRFFYTIITQSIEIENKKRIERDLTANLFLKIKELPNVLANEKTDTSVLGKLCNPGDIILCRTLNIPANELAKTTPNWECPADNINPLLGTNSGECGFEARGIYIIDGAGSFEFTE